MIQDNTIKYHSENGKRWALPEVLQFGQGIKNYMSQYKVLGFRAPKKTEFYLSGAPTSVWVAPNDLTTEFLIVKPTIEMKRATGWVKK
jgi:hypothetical protein